MRFQLRSMWAIFACSLLLAIGCQKDLDETAYDFACESNADCSGGWECLPSEEYDTDICQPADDASDAGDTEDVRDTEQDASDTSDISDVSDSETDASDTADTSDADAEGQDTCTETNEGVEKCDGVDNDCDGVVDEGVAFEATDLVAGESHVCAIGPNGSVFCWGDNTEGKAVPGTAAERPDVASRPTRNTGLTISSPDQLELAAGMQHTCLVQEGKRVSCWGRADDGRLGPGGTTSGLVNTFGPEQISDFDGANNAFGQVEAGDQFTCARELGGFVYCWGYNENFRMGADVSGAATADPTRISGLGDTDSFAIGSTHGCSVSGTEQAVPNGETTVECWGDSFEGKTGDTTDSYHGPRQLDGTLTADVGSGFIGIEILELGGTFSCAYNTQELLCWGSNSQGQLAAPEDDPASSETPLRVTLPGDATVNIGAGFDGIAAGVRHGCVLDSDFEAYCWGAGFEGQLGHGESGPNEVERTPRPVAGGRTFRQIVAGTGFTCAIVGDAVGDEPGQVYCWGINDTQQLGLGPSGDADSYDTPQPVACALDDASG